MRVILNGNEVAVPDETTVATLLQLREVEAIRVAVEINEDIVPRRTFDNRVIHEGDRIEIATFVGGG
jgi:sulfur carrier protein